MFRLSPEGGGQLLRELRADVPRDQALLEEVYKKLKEIEGLNIVASGGISFEREIIMLRDLVHGAILGKAIYSGALDLERSIKLGEKQGDT